MTEFSSVVPTACTLWSKYFHPPMTYDRSPDHDLLSFCSLLYCLKLNSNERCMSCHFLLLPLSRSENSPSITECRSATQSSALLDLAGESWGHWQRSTDHFCCLCSQRTENEHAGAARWELGIHLLFVATNDKRS